MQFLLNTDKNTDGRHEMSEHVEAVVREAVAHFADQVTRVDAYLSDENSAAKAAPDDIHCTLEARLAQREPVVVKSHAASAHQAITAAAAKLKRALTSALSKHGSRHVDDPLTILQSDRTID
jgi:ribosome-associated translation inhibitor RaiA